MQLQTIVHTIPPLYDSESRVLLLGSIPSPKSREVGFFYGHPQNRFWRVLAAVLGEEVPVSIEDKRAMPAASCGAVGTPSPNAILRARPTRLSATPSRTTSANCPREQNYAHFLPPAASRRSCTANSSSRKPACPSRSCPSTSPANAAWSLERLIEAYRVIL